MWLLSQTYHHMLSDANASLACQVGEEICTVDYIRRVYISAVQEFAKLPERIEFCRIRKKSAYIR